MLWFETCSEFWTDTLYPNEDALELFQKHYKPLEWEVMRPLWPRRCFLTGKWLWRHKHYRLKMLHKSSWWERPDSTEYCWIDLEYGTQIRFII
jgi:hypothetical protein